MLKNGLEIDKLNVLFSTHNLTTLAIQQGFMKRKPRKIDPQSFLIALFLVILQHASSLRKIALMLGSMKSMLISKQAIDKRINEAFVQFLEQVLAYMIAHKIDTPPLIPSLFKRIIVHDSSTVRLPDHLAKEFPGSKNQKGKTYAMIKIQTLYDLRTEQFCHFQLTPFTVNDQEAAKEDSQWINEHDLVIRDLGYFGSDAFTHIIQRKAFFISRLRFGIALFDPHSGKRVNLLAMLKKHQQIDMPILMGASDKLSVRLIAVPVDSTVAARRRRKLKNHRDSRRNPSKEHLAMLGWNIFILNVDQTLLSLEDVLTLYQLRWRIEIIFKSWKSNFHLTSIPHASLVRVKAYVFVFLILVTLFHASLVRYMHRYARPISLLKLSKLCCEQLVAILFFYQGAMASLWKQINYHCAYEKRNDRLNFYQKINLLS